VRQLTGDLPAEPEPWDPEPDQAGVLPQVARNSVAGKILQARMSRAMESDPFRDAASALGDAEPAEAARLAREGRLHADRAIGSIDACLDLLAVETA
jgi:hypothetical protein